MRGSLAVVFFCLVAAVATACGQASEPLASVAGAESSGAPDCDPFVATGVPAAQASILVAAMVSAAATAGLVIQPGEVVVTRTTPLAGPACEAVYNIAVQSPVVSFSGRLSYEAETFEGLGCFDTGTCTQEAVGGLHVVELTEGETAVLVTTGSGHPLRVAPPETRAWGFSCGDGSVSLDDIRAIALGADWAAIADRAAMHDS